MDDKEDSYGRATVALTRATQYTYILSPVDMAGLVGMAQVLAVFHTGFYTLNRGEIQSHGTALAPTDTSAIFEWGLDAPLLPQDRPPLSIAMVVHVNHTRVLRRYRLVLANRRKLNLLPKVAECFSTQSNLFRLTRSGFFPSSTTLDILYGYASDGYRSPLWLCASHNGRAVLIHRNRGSKVGFAQAVQEERIRVVKGIQFFDAHRLVPQLLMSPELQLDPRTENVSGPDGAEESVADPESDGELSSVDEAYDTEIDPDG